MTTVFISYSHKDKEYALKLVEDMRRQGIESWIDNRIEFGDEWPRAIQENLERSKAMVIIMSSSSFSSKWVHNELIFAENRGKIILPLLLEGDVWLNLSSTQYADVRGGKFPPDIFYNKIKQITQRTAVSSLQPKLPNEQLPASEELALIDRIARYLKSAIINRQKQMPIIGLYKINFIFPIEKFSLYGHTISFEISDTALLKKYDPYIHADYQVRIEALEKRLNKEKKNIDPVTGKPVEDWIGSLFNYSMPRSDIEKKLNLYLNANFNREPSDGELRELAKRMVQIHKEHHIPISAIKIT